MFGSFFGAFAAKRMQLNFKSVSKVGFEVQTEIEMLEHKKAKAPASHASDSSGALRLEIASAWGFTSSCPVPRNQRGGTKGKSAQGWHGALLFGCETEANSDSFITLREFSPIRGKIDGKIDRRRIYCPVMLNYA